MLLDKPELVAARPELHWRVVASNDHVVRVVVGGVGAELLDQLVAVGHVVFHTRIPRVADGRHSHWRQLLEEHVAGGRLGRVGLIAMRHVEAHGDVAHRVGVDGRVGVVAQHADNRCGHLDILVLIVLSRYIAVQLPEHVALHVLHLHALDARLLSANPLGRIVLTDLNA